MPIAVPPRLEDLAVLSPYLTARIQRFGEYATDEIELTPEPFDAHLELDLAVSGAEPTA